MKERLILLLIIILSTLLRLTYLATAPPSLNWDEVSVGWNAYSLLTTGSDEYGNRWPLSIRSFNDFKPPVYTYSDIPVMALLGRTELAVRLPSVLAGIGAVIVLYLFVGQLLQFNGQTRGGLPLLAALLLATSPWHLQFSRIAFEASLALLFFLTGALFLLLFFNKSKAYYLFLSILSFVLSAYTHHSVKLILPLFLLLVAICYRGYFLKKWRSVLLGAFFGFILLLPMVRNSLRSQGQVSRFATVSIFAQANSFHNRGDPVPVVLIKNYFSHLDPRFLFWGIGDNPRHHAPFVGVLLLWSLPFILLGIGSLVRKKPKYLGLLLIWFILSPLAAIFSIDNPHASRSFLYIPMHVIVTAFGLAALTKKRGLVPVPMTLIVVIAFSLNLLYFFHQYFLVMPKSFSSDWQYGYKELVQSIQARQSRYQKVYISSAYDQPYIYFLFYGSENNILKNDGTFSQQIGKYYFVNFKAWTKADWDSLEGNPLLAVSSDDPVSGLKTLREIQYPDGQTAFRLVEKPVDAL